METRFLSGKEEKARFDVYILGIDPGMDGAIVALDHNGQCIGSVLTKKSLTVSVGKGSRREYVPSFMADALSSWGPLSTIKLVVLEKQQAMPKQGVASMFRTGVGYGLWLGILAAKGLPTTIVRPVEWTKTVLKGVSGTGKDRAIVAASARVPDLDLTPGKKRVPHSGLADAACLALYGINK